MQQPVKDWNKWYIAQGFGVKTSYGVHEGLDINLKTGGDSDLGQDLLAVADGKIVYYHNLSHPTTTFGRHMVLECQTSVGTRWYHYAHCQSITTQVKEVKEGEVIGKLGKSGTTIAHLHFSVFKVDPKSLYNGIDTIAKTAIELNNCWEEFKIMEDVRESELEEEKRLHEDTRTQLRETEANYEEQKTIVDDYKKSIEEICQQLTLSAGGLPSLKSGC